MIRSEPSNDRTRVFCSNSYLFGDGVAISAPGGVVMVVGAWRGSGALALVACRRVVVGGGQALGAGGAQVQLAGVDTLPVGEGAETGPVAGAATEAGGRVAVVVVAVQGRVHVRTPGQTLFVRHLEAVVAGAADAHILKDTKQLEFDYSTP